MALISLKRLIFLFGEKVLKLYFTISCLCLTLIFAGCETVKTANPEGKKSVPSETVQTPSEKSAEKPKEASYPVEPEVILENGRKCAAKKMPEEPEIIDSASPKKNLNKLILPEENTSRFLSSDSFVERWKVLGSFSFSLEDVKTANEAIHKEFIPNEQNLTDAFPAPKGVFWKYYKFKNEKPVGIVDLNKLFGNGEKREKDVAAYAVTVLDSPKELDNLILYTGGSDFIKVWINGTLVHAYNKEPRKGDIDQDAIKGVKLAKGLNHVVVKVVKVSGEWSFFFRFATENNIPIRIDK